MEYSCLTYSTETYKLWISFDYSHKMYIWFSPSTGAAVPPSRRDREPRAGTLRDRHGSYGARGDDDYLPLGVRLSPRSAMTRGDYSGSRPGDYPPRQRGVGAHQREAMSGYAAYSESSPRLKQPYSIVVSS